MKNILICGFGNIGHHIYDEFNSIGRTDKSIYITIDDISFKPQSLRVNYLEEYFDTAFICVPTDMLSDGSCDISAVDEAVSKINADVIVIKSTVPVGTNKMLSEKYKKNIVFSPEYYGTTIQSPKSPDFLILSGSKANMDKAANLYHKVKPADFKIIYTDYETAELAKYMENCFLALKVSFCSEFFDICQKNNVSYNELREIFVMDKRMGKSHTYINPEQPYYDSHCLNKDIPALLKQCHNMGVDVPIIEAMVNENLLKKEKIKKSNKNNN